MSPTARRLQLIANFIPDSVLHDQYTPGINAKSRFLEYHSERFMQAPNVFLDRGSGHSSRQDRAPVRVFRMKLVEIICADSQLNLARTLRQAAVIREIIKKKALCQRKPQLIFATTINKKYGIDLLAR
jgi:hypothetical protein